jgi:hypothetical protein
VQKILVPSPHTLWVLLRHAYVQQSSEEKGSFASPLKYGKFNDVTFHRSTVWGLTRCCLTLLTHGAEAFLRSRQFCSSSRIFQHFIEPESLLPCSQEPSTGPYPESDQSNPYHVVLAIVRNIWIITGQGVRYLDMSFLNTVCSLVCNRQISLKKKRDWGPVLMDVQFEYISIAVNVTVKSPVTSACVC